MDITEIDHVMNNNLQNNNLQNNTHILNVYIDHIYVLYISPCEIYHIKKLLTMKNITAEYFLGIDGANELFDEYNDYITYNPNHNLKSMGAYGHLHSFIKLLKDAIQNNYKNILILEPDVYFSTDFDTCIEKYLQMNYKLLYLGASQHDWSEIDHKINKQTPSKPNINKPNINKPNINKPNIIKPKSNKPSINKPKDYYCAHKTCGTFGIIIDSTIFQEYLSLLEEKTHPSDICLFVLHKKYNNCYVTYPNLICCDVTKSTTSGRRIQIDMMNKFKWTRDYVLENEYQFTVKINIQYQIKFKINSYTKLQRKYMTISDGNDKITNINLSDENLKKDMYVYLYKSQTNCIVITTFNIFIDDIMLDELIIANQ